MNSSKQFFRDYLTKSVRSFRLERNMTQEKMAEQLQVTARAYGDLERGKFCLSAVTLLRFQMMLSNDELIEFMDALREELLNPDDSAKA